MTPFNSPNVPSPSTPPTNVKPSWQDLFPVLTPASPKIDPNPTGWMQQPKPTKNDFPAVWKLVQIDMLQRDEFGYKKYGVPLQPHNGRDALQDAYEEALDLTVYLRQCLYERNGK